jgi:curved DNA-binding protein CbpA|uniref:J domain-containing protein n=1 Tax=viral metagenome TaxID=1070528 RepID=A0A6C0EEI6_9ZZZZ
MNLYEILEIDHSASEIEIKKSYLRLVKLYHPDKNNSSDSNEKFMKVQSAYEILINEKLRNNYIKMPDEEKQTFLDILDKIINNKINFCDLIKYCNNIEEIDINHIENNFMEFLKKINVDEVLNIVKGFFPKKKLNNIIYSESDIDIYDDNYADFYDILPISFQKYNKLDIKIELNITLNDIFNCNKKKIKIKRNINNESITCTFIFTITNPYIIYSNYGDVLDIDTGDLIIKLNLPNNLYWNNNTILISKLMTLYEMIYGLNLKIDIGDNKNVIIDNWIPCKDGLIIDLNNYYFINSHKFILKLFLDWNDTLENKELLKRYFS